jgi:hypothetical protein
LLCPRFVLLAPESSSIEVAIVFSGNFTTTLKTRGEARIRDCVRRALQKDGLLNRRRPTHRNRRAAVRVDTYRRHKPRGSSTATYSASGDIVIFVSFRTNAVAD